MKRAVRWRIAAKVVGVADRILDLLLLLCFLAVIAFGIFGVWSNIQPMLSASVDSEILMNKPTAGSKEHLKSFDALKQINSDICAWITIPDTKIDYPVVQGADNTTYLNRSPDGKNAAAGSIFLDYRNSSSFQDFYSLLYGHHMTANLMFGEIPSFLNPSFFQNHPTGTLYLPDETDSITFFACVETDAYDTALFNPSGLTTAESQTATLNHIREIAVQYREVTFAENTRIIGLSTCDNVSTDGRIILFGVLEKQS